MDHTDALVLEEVIGNGASLSALHSEIGQIDLMTSIAGFDYPEFAEDASTFEVAGQRFAFHPAFMMVVRVGPHNRVSQQGDQLDPWKRLRNSPRHSRRT